MSRSQHASENTLKMDKDLETFMSVRPFVDFFVNGTPPTFLVGFGTKNHRMFLIMLPIAYCQVLRFVAALRKRGSSCYTLFHFFNATPPTFFNGIE